MLVLLGMVFAGIPLALLGLARMAEAIIPTAWIERLLGDPYTEEREES